MDPVIWLTRGFFQNCDSDKEESLMPRRSSLELEVGPSLFLAQSHHDKGFSFLKFVFFSYLDSSPRVEHFPSPDSNCIM